GDLHRLDDAVLHGIGWWCRKRESGRARSPRRRVAAARGAIEQLVEVTPRHQRGDQRNTQRLHGLRTRGCKRRTASAGGGTTSSAAFVGAGAATCGFD